MGNEISSRLRERLEAARQAASLTQADVEARLGLPGGAVSKIEAGTREVSSTELASFAHLVGKNVGWFFEEDRRLSPVHFRGQVSDDESRRDLAWLYEFAAAYRGLVRRLRAEGAKPTA
jgi:transcriptional regulator with XRE-family HTH domain